MADNIEHQDKGELVANCDQLQNDEVVVTTPVESRIMSIRGKQIMIDRDLAELYGVETRVLNQAVKRNIERFPDDFRIELSREECLRSQIVISKKDLKQSLDLKSGGPLGNHSNFSLRHCILQILLHFQS